MRAVVAVAVLAATVGIVNLLIWFGVRAYRELSADADPKAPLLLVSRTRFAGMLVIAPTLAFFWLEPPARTWVATIYLVSVILVLSMILVRRRNAHPS